MTNYDVSSSRRVRLHYVIILVTSAAAAVARRITKMTWREIHQLAINFRLGRTLKNADWAKFQTENVGVEFVEKVKNKDTKSDPAFVRVCRRYVHGILFRFLILTQVAFLFNSITVCLR